MDINQPLHYEAKQVSRVYFWRRTMLGLNYSALTFSVWRCHFFLTTFEYEEAMGESAVRPTDGSQLWVFRKR